MTNEIKMTFFSQILMFSILITSCDGQPKTEQENVTEMKTSLTVTAKQQGEIIIDTSRQTKLDFSKIAGNFDNVYSNVHNGFQDKAGNIWFSTTGAGAIRFDGKFFNHITIIDNSNNNSIIPLLEDKQGNIWFASANGIYHYDGKVFANIPTASANNTVQISIPNTSAKRTSMSVISAMQDKKGNIWFGTETNGVYFYDGQSLTNFLSQKGIINSGGLKLNAITSMMEDKKGNIWFASWNNEGLCCYDGKSITNYTSKNGLGDDMIYSIYEDEVGNIWIGSRNHGVWRYDGKSFANISGLTDLKGEAIYSIKQDNNRNFWFATQSKGVWKYDGNNFTNFTTRDGLHNNSVFCIVPEKNGNLWFGSRGMGLSMYDGKIFTDLTKN